jgi:hypothetical protein
VVSRVKKSLSVSVELAPLVAAELLVELEVLVVLGSCDPVGNAVTVAGVVITRPPEFPR